MSLRAGIVEDEPLARERLRRLLGGHDDVQIVLERAHGQALSSDLLAMPVDVLFLDVEMPGADGFQALEGVPEPWPYVVFVTAHAQFAPRAFDIAAVDYLLKPLAEDRLAVALDRVRERIAARPAPANGYLTRLALPVGRRIQLVDVGDIDSLQAQANYVEVNVGERQYVLRSTLGRLEARLDPAHFLRVHRSWLVRLDAVRSAEPLPSGRYRLRLGSGAVLTSGRQYRDCIRERLGIRG